MKLPATAGLSRPGVSLRIINTADTPSIVRFIDLLPSGYALASIEANSIGEPEWTALADGFFEGAVPVLPRETVAFTYLLADPDDPDVPVQSGALDLPDPEIVEVIAIDAEQIPDSPAFVWHSPTEDVVPLVTHDPTGQPAVVDSASLDGWLVERDRSDGSPRTEIREDTTADRYLSSPESRPVIGIVAREANADAVLATILRAKGYGFSVFVTYQDSPDIETIHLSEQLGATVIDPATSARGNEAMLERTLSRAARDAGHPGIVYQLPECPRIDYERTLAAFESDGFETTAIPKEWSSPSKQPHVIIGIPAYNAEGSIGEVVEAAKPFADVVLVVDDGSDDATATRAREAGATVVVHERNRGYGGALKTIFRESNQRGAVHLVTLDADGQHDPTDVPKLLQAQKREGADIVIGSRYVAGSTTRLPFIRSVGLGTVNLLTNLSMGRLVPRTWIRDTQSGFRVYSDQVLASLVSAGDIGDGMWASTDIMYHADAEGFTFAEIGTTIRYDVEYGSTQGALSHGTGLVQNIGGFLERTHPLLLLGLPGALGVLIGVFFGIMGLPHLLMNESSLFSILAATVFVVIGIGLVMLSVLFHAMNTHPLYQRMQVL